MAFIQLSDLNGTKKIMIFAEGTIIKPKSWFSLYNHNAYIPIGNAVGIIGGWRQQGADISYCTSRRGKQAKEIAALLKRYGFAGSNYTTGKRSGAIMKSWN